MLLHFIMFYLLVGLAINLYVFWGHWYYGEAITFDSLTIPDGIMIVAILLAWPKVIIMDLINPYLSWKD